ncbi:MAG: serine/threonine-protein kinase [Gemmata sp.]
MPYTAVIADRAEFLEMVRAAGLLPPHLLQKAGAVAGAGSAAGAAAELVAAGLLTRFQADRVLAGYTDGFHLGQYVILDQIGRGALSRVYRAKHRTMHRVVAVKVLSAELSRTAEAREALRRELRTAGKLVHPNIVTVFDVNELKDRFYLVLELVDGPHLGELVARRGPLPVAEACELIRQLAQGLRHAHEQGMVHGALKPSNVLVARPTASAPVLVKVADFALPRFGPPSAYAAPEPARAARADLYALGGLFHLLLAGRPPGGERPDRPRPDVPPAVAAVVSRLLARPPGARFASAAELLAHLGAALVPAPIPADSVSFEPPPSAGPYTSDSGYLTGRHARPDGFGGRVPVPHAGAFAAPSPWEQLADEAAGATAPMELDDTPAPPPPKVPRQPPPAPGHGEPVPLWMLAALLLSAVLLTGMGIVAVAKLLAG